MNTNRVSAIFDTQDQAKSAVEALIEAGVPRTAINYAGRESSDVEAAHVDYNRNAEDKVDTADVAKGVALGGTFGALLSIAVLAIPFVGPAVAAGAIGSAVVPGVAITGGLIGGAIGGIQQSLIDHGFDEHDAAYFSEHLDKGATLITVDATAAGTADVAGILAANGGHRRIADTAAVDSDAALA